MDVGEHRVVNIINYLPEEVVEHILRYSHIDIGDVVKFGLTCKHLYKTVCNSNKIWRHKFFQRWPQVKRSFEDLEESRIQFINWREAVQDSLINKREMIHRISLMSCENYKRQEVSNHQMKGFDKLFLPEEGAHPMVYYVLVEELIRFMELPIITSNLTHRYYALKVLRYLKQCHLKDVWTGFINLPEKQQTMERGATILSQWSQPESRITYSQIADVLDSIAEQTKEVLRVEYPFHSMFTTARERFIMWKNNIIDDNQWSVTETRQVIDAMCRVLFDILGFSATSEMYDNPENSFIDHVLLHRRGIPITLSIVFESIARRLGIRCEPVNFPSHFLLRWKESYTSPDAKDSENYYIDVFNRGNFLTKKNCPRVSGLAQCPFQGFQTHEVACTIEVVKTMVSILEVANSQHNHLNGRSTRLRSAFELRYLVHPTSTHAFIQLVRFYVLHQMELSDLINMLEDLKRNIDWRSGEESLISDTLPMLIKPTTTEEDVQPRERVPGVKYAVGLIMRHLEDDYLCVITGWDPYYKPPGKLREDIGDDEEENMPFYNVLVDGGSSRYVAEGNLIIAPDPQWINNCEIGRHFCKFKGTYYLPNDEKAGEYPKDETVRYELLQYAYGILTLS